MDDMVSRVVFFGMCLVCAASLGSLAFFLLFTNPDYLGISGFAFFYASLFAALWSAFYLAGSSAIRRKRVRASLRHSLVRRSGLLAAVATGGVTLSQFGMFAWYTFLILAFLAVLADRWIEGR